VCARSLIKLTSIWNGRAEQCCTLGSQVEEYLYKGLTEQPHSRMCETEADEVGESSHKHTPQAHVVVQVGLMLAARACYDPSAGAK
jgi:hypothetical protein